MDAADIEFGMRNFTGTDHYYRYVGKLVLTDGVRWLAESAKCFWMLDLIASHQAEIRRKGREDYGFQVWTLLVKDSKAVASCDDGNGRVLARQVIEFTDFPLAKLVLYLAWEGDERAVLMVPTEY